MERNIVLDNFKIFLSILVILIHLDPIFGTWDSLIGYEISNGFCRMAVPCFFMINGYFLTSKIYNINLVGKYLKKLFIILIVWSLIYLPFIANYIYYKQVFYLIMGIHHLWYLPALLVAALFFYVLKKFIKNEHIMLILGLILFLFGCYIQYSLRGQDYNPMNLYKYRNAIFLALPFVILGSYIRKYESVFIKMKNIYLFIILIIGFVLVFLEAYYSFKSNYWSDIYMSFFIVCPVSFILILKYSRYGESSLFKAQLSEAIYFIHPLMILLVRVMNLNYSPNKLLSLPVILLFTLIASIGLIEVNKRVKIFL